MHAIPTKHAGRQYRSRIEARYAAWFDLVLRGPFRRGGAPVVEYEPFDLSGYIPDFALERDGTRQIIEVKGPSDAFDLEKIRRAGWDHEVISCDWRGPRHATKHRSHGPHEMSPFEFWCVDNTGWETLEAIGKDARSAEWRRRAPFWAWDYGLIDMRAWEDDWGRELDRLWVEAGNLVQWRTPR